MPDMQRDRGGKAMSGSVVLDRASVGYGTKVVIRDITLEVERGEILALVGPNGGGKSTVLKTIAGQIRALGGSVAVAGKDPKETDPRELAKMMAVVLTGRIRPERMTGFDVAAMGRYPYTGRMGILSAEDRRITEESLELLEARDLAEVPFEEMSDGQKQRILLARALCQEPEILVLDEPTSYLDIRYKIMLAKLLRKLAREKNMTVLLSLHEPEMVPYLADRVLCVKGDTIFRQGKPEEILTREGICELYGIPEKDYEESWLKFISDTGCGNGVY